MITDNDITKLKTVFATKEELADLRLEVAEIKETMSEGFGSLAAEMHEMNAKFDRTLGELDNARVENAAEAMILNRHERQIHALAAGTGVQIPQD